MIFVLTIFVFMVGLFLGINWSERRQRQINKKNNITVICECGDHIDLKGKRDYVYKNGKYYCTECMGG